MAETIRVTEEAWIGLKQEVAFLRTDNDRLRGENAALTAEMAGIREALGQVRRRANHYRQGILRLTRGPWSGSIIHAANQILVNAPPLDAETVDAVPTDAPRKGGE